MSPNTRIVFFDFFKRKGWKDIKKKAIETHSHIKKTIVIKKQTLSKTMNKNKTAQKITF